MKKLVIFGAILIAAMLVFLIYGPEGSPANNNSTDINNKPNVETVKIANPASVNCVELGGVSVLKKDADGGEFSMCTLSDGRECEEWALFRGECKFE